MGGAGPGARRATAKLVALVSYKKPRRPGQAEWEDEHAQAAFVRWYCTEARPPGRNRPVHIAENYVTVYTYAVIRLETIEGPAVMLPDPHCDPEGLPCFFELDRETRGF